MISLVCTPIEDNKDLDNYIRDYARIKIYFIQLQ